MRRSAAKSLLPILVASLFIAIAGAPPPVAAREDMSIKALTPPMGWNSWDSWGLTINESQFRDTVTWFHNNLQRFGWQYVVVDEGWFAQHPENPTGQQDYTLSDDGRYTPALNRFPSLPVSQLERTERLEQLRYLENGFAIYVEPTDYDTIGVDTEADLRLVEQLLRERAYA